MAPPGGLGRGAVCETETCCTVWPSWVSWPTKVATKLEDESLRAIAKAGKNHAGLGEKIVERDGMRNAVGAGPGSDRRGHGEVGNFCARASGKGEVDAACS